MIAFGESIDPAWFYAKHSAIDNSTTVQCEHSYTQGSVILSSLQRLSTLGHFYNMAVSFCLEFVLIQGFTATVELDYTFKIGHNMSLCEYGVSTKVAVYLQVDIICTSDVYYV